MRKTALPKIQISQRFYLTRLLAALFFLGTAVAVNAPVATASDPIRILNEELISKLVKKTLPYNVVLPRDYGAPEARNKRYPVVYLLHGFSGHFSDWTTRTKLPNYSSRHEVIIVTPEGNNGWYTDSASNPDDKYETYIIQELIPEVDRKFRTIASRDGRAIAGLSMGGFGALKFAVKYPEKFAFAGSMSGALFAASWVESDLKGLGAIWRSLVEVFGSADGPTRDSNDITKLYRELNATQIKQLPYIYFDCGTEDMMLNANRSFAAMLLEQKIPHEVRLLPGTHGWQYWDQQVVEVLRVATARMASARNGSAATAVTR